MARRTQSIDLLKSVPLFDGLSDAQLKTVARQMREESFGEGTDIVVQGERGGGFFLLLEGRAVVLVDGRRRRQLGPGDFFGEMSLFDDRPRAGTVRATTRVKTLTMTTWNFLATLEENWAITKKVLAHLSEQIRRLDKIAGQP